METLELIRVMRDNRIAPVDTLGCHKLANSNDQKTFRFQILVSLMLSSQTKDEITAQAFSLLQKMGELSIDSVCKWEEESIDECIRKVGFHKRKAKYLKQTAEILKTKYDSDVPEDYNDLIQLPGVGPKMAYLALQYAWNKNLGIGVDVHVHRISNRLGWVRTRNAEDTRIKLQELFPQEKWKEINPLLVGLGQTICTAKKPKCSECLCSSVCPSSSNKDF